MILYGAGADGGGRLISPRPMARRGAVWYRELFLRDGRRGAGQVRARGGGLRRGQFAILPSHPRLYGEARISPFLGCLLVLSIIS